jgi:hypothetical protein
MRLEVLDVQIMEETPWRIFCPLFSSQLLKFFPYISCTIKSAMSAPATCSAGAGSREKSGVERGASTPGRLGYIGKQLMLRIGLDRIVFRVLKIRTDVFIEA